MGGPILQGGFCRQKHRHMITDPKIRQGGRKAGREPKEHDQKPRKPEGTQGRFGTLWVRNPPTALPPRGPWTILDIAATDARRREAANQTRDFHEASGQSPGFAHRRRRRVPRLATDRGSLPTNRRLRSTTAASSQEALVATKVVPPPPPSSHCSRRYAPAGLSSALRS